MIKCLNGRLLVVISISLVLAGCGGGGGGGATPPIVNPPILSNNASLASLTLDGVMLDTPFQATQTAYSADGAEIVLAEMQLALSEVGYPDVGYERGLISVLIETAEIHRYMEHYDQAEALATDIIERLKVRSTGANTQNVDIGRAHIQRAEIRTDSGDISGARNDFEIGIPILQSILGAEHKESVDAQTLMERIEQPSSL